MPCLLLFSSFQGGVGEREAPIRCCVAINYIAGLLPAAGPAGVLEGAGAKCGNVCRGSYAWDLESGRPPEHFG